MSKKYLKHRKSIGQIQDAIRSITDLQNKKASDRNDN